LFVKELAGRNVHAESITLFINDLVHQAGIRYNDIDAVAVSCGPGSYTGLRIGISTAKGLCFALDKPLIAIETLERMAQGIIDNPELITPHQSPLTNPFLCPMIDARRMEVYTAIYNLKGENIQPTTAEIIDENSFANLLK